jgi:hypothetical protein
VTRKKDDGFASCALMALAAALADFNYKDAEIIVAAMAKEYGVGTYARRAREVLHQGHDLLHGMFRTNSKRRNVMRFVSSLFVTDDQSPN